MKELILVRHAKSGWDYNVEDENRPLTQGGIKRAQTLAQILKEKLPFMPEFWQSSHAARATHTSLIFARTFNAFNQLVISEDQYTFNARVLLQLIHELPNEFESAILFGHNDALNILVNQMAGIHVHFGTANVAWLSFETNNWSNVEKGKLRLLLSKNDL